jgi:hypothetical protein
VKVEDSLLSSFDREVTIVFDGGQAVQGASLSNLLGNAENSLTVVLPNLYGGRPKGPCGQPSYCPPLVQTRRRQIPLAQKPPIPIRAAVATSKPTPEELPAPASEFRQWTANDGAKTVLAELMRVEGEKIWFKRASGKVAQTRITNLCDADQLLVRNWQSSKDLATTRQ